MNSEDSDQTVRMPRLSESSLGAHATLLVLSCGGSNNSVFFKLQNLEKKSFGLGVNFRVT